MTPPISSCLPGPALTLAFTACLVAFSCGQRGKDGGSGAGAPVAPPASPASDPAWLGGELNLAGVDDLGGRYGVLLYDHTQFAAAIYSFDSDNRFTFHLSAFQEGHIYSLHVVTEAYQYLSPIALGVDSAGEPLSAFRYEGGLGTDLGEIALSLDSWGAAGSEPPRGRLGGGFALFRGMTGRLDDLQVPSPLQAFEVRHELILQNPRDVYDLFLAAARPDTGGSLAEWGSVLVALAGRDGVEVTSAAFEPGPGWLGRLKLSAAGEAAPGHSQAAFISEQGNGLIRTGKNAFSSRLYPGQFLLLGHLGLLQVSMRDEQNLVLPVIFKSAVGFPQVLEAQSLDGGPEETVDAASSGRNGFSEPLCLPDEEIILHFTPPLAANGASFAGDVLAAAVHVRFMDEAGVFLEAEDYAFGGEFAAAFEYSGVGGASYRWDPSAGILQTDLAPGTGPLLLDMKSGMLRPTGSGAFITHLQFSLETPDGLVSSIAFNMEQCP